MDKVETIQKNSIIEYLFEIVSAAYVIIVVLSCWKLPLIATVLLGAGLGAQLFFWKEKADVATMIAAAALGTPSEMLCVKYGVWSYYAPGLVGGIPVWIPLVWAYLFCFYRRLSITIHTSISKKWPDNRELPVKLINGMMGGMIMVYYVTAFFLISKKFAVTYFVFTLPAVIFWHKQRDMLIFIIGAVCGTVGEYLCMKLGFWVYQYPYLRSIGLPISLPLAWGLSVVIISNIARKWERR
jgi:hypothetical protein